LRRKRGDYPESKPIRDYKRLLKVVEEEVLAEKGGRERETVILGIKKGELGVRKSGG